MAKNALGRGLGDLLPERRETPGGEGEDALRAHGSRELGPGLRVLAHQRHGLLPTPTSGSRASWSVAKGVIGASLLLADVVLVGLTVLWRHEAASTMSKLDVMVCVTAVLVGAWAALLGVWLYLKD